MSKTCALYNKVKPGYGHTVSNSNIKTKRRFLPNVQKQTLPSEVLGVNLYLKIAIKTMRTIAKHGGLDQYLLTRAAKDLTPKGLKLKRSIVKKMLAKGTLPAVVKKPVYQPQLSKRQQKIKDAKNS